MPRRLTPDARRVAAEILLRVETTGAFADVLLARRLADTPLAPPEQALATRLVFGTLAWQGRLDFHLDGLLRTTPVARLDPPVRAALRLGLYQLLFLARVPAYAAVGASVDLARVAGRGATGLVNAVLRRAAAAREAGLPLPDSATNPILRLAVEWSHPAWLVARWASELGTEGLPALLAADNAQAPTVVRANRGRTTRAALAAELATAGIAASPCRFAPDGLALEGGGARLRGLAAWREGRLAFQGEASQLVVALLGLAPGSVLLDACAAPGGKATYAAEHGAKVTALDRRAGGVRRLAGEAARLGLHLRAVAGDARRPPLRGPFDAVLVDAPCSGLGTLRRHPELRWRRRPEDVARLAGLQQEILAGVAPLVRPGGVLVYAVCTLTHEETAGAVDAFRTAHPRFALEDAAGPLPVAVTAGPFLRTLPHRQGLDGFFAARLRAGR